ncbi:hypothetical protein [Candidatus Methanarcanum hacksteinii]|uniref:hypothetical protein n=1 Tax=Candidatus Methanarcanum hacksteinii TaxID=2911857 RepID=UPI0037DC3880
MAENSLVINKIESMEIDEKYKKAMIDLFRSELQHGNISRIDVKKNRATKCREIVIKVISRENI